MPSDSTRPHFCNSGHTKLETTSGDQLETSWRPGGADRINNILQAALVWGKWGPPAGDQLLQAPLSSCVKQGLHRVSLRRAIINTEILSSKAPINTSFLIADATLWMFQGLSSCEALHTQLTELLCSLKNAHQPHPTYTSDL